MGHVAEADGDVERAFDRPIISDVDDLLGQIASAQRGVSPSVKQAWAENDHMCQVPRGGHRLWAIMDRVVVPCDSKEIKEELLRRAHDGAGHGYVQRTLRRLWAAGITWASITSEVTEYCRSCLHCQRCKPPAHDPALNGVTGSVPGSRPNETLVIDYLELPQSGRFKYLLVMIDKFTRFCELVPFAEANAIRSCEGLQLWTQSHGIPSRVQFDGGSHFDNERFRSYLQRNGIEANMGAPHHAQAQGVVERLNRVLVEALRTLKSAQRDYEWSDHVHELRNVVNSAYHSSLGASPFHVMRGYPFRGELDARLDRPEQHFLCAEDFMGFVQAWQQYVAAKQEAAFGSYAAARDAHQRRTAFMVGDLVWLLDHSPVNKLSPRQKGPYFVHKRLHSNSYLVRSVIAADVPEQQFRVSIDQMVPVYGEVTNAEAMQMLLQAGQGWVEAILSHRVISGQYEFEVKFLEADEPRWLPLASLVKVKLVSTYLAKKGLSLALALGQRTRGGPAVPPAVPAPAASMTAAAPAATLQRSLAVAAAAPAAAITAPAVSSAAAATLSSAAHVETQRRPLLSATASSPQQTVAHEGRRGGKGSKRSVVASSVAAASRKHTGHRSSASRGGKRGKAKRAALSAPPPSTASSSSSSSTTPTPGVHSNDREAIEPPVSATSAPLQRAVPAVQSTSRPPGRGAKPTGQATAAPAATHGMATRRRGRDT